MNKSSMALLAAAILGMSGWVAIGQGQNAAVGKAPPDIPFINIVPVEKAPVIDGILDDDCWNKAEKSQIFTDEYGFPFPGKAVTFQVCQKDEVLYLAARAEYTNGKGSPPSNTKLHDGTFWVGNQWMLLVDPDGDATPGYYEFAQSMNKADGGFKDVTGDWYLTGRYDEEGVWEPKYEVKGQWSEKEWVLEYALPLSIFNRTPVVYENFGLQLALVDGGIGVWSAHHGETLHTPHRFGEARGLKGKNVTTNPSGLFRDPFVRVNNRVIKAQANPSLVPEKKPELVAGPEVKTSGGSADIGFEVNTKTDVAVWIEDAKGERVRHLAAGMLGSNPPAPLVRNTLQQTVRWDYTDDWGKKVAPGSYKVKVGVGSEAHLDRFIGTQPTPREIQALAVDGKGGVYVVSGIRDEWMDLQHYDANGKYLNTVFPPPGNLPAEKLKGLNIIDYGPDGRVIFGSHRDAAWLPHLDQPMPHTLLVNSKGQIITFGSEYPGGPARFYKLNPDGSLPDDFLGPYVKDTMWTQYYEEWAKRFHFALDPRDENVIYLSGLKEVHRFEMNPDETKDRRATYFNAVCKLRWGEKAPLETFVGKRNFVGKAGGNGPGEFQDPQGIVFDAKGRLWVCDRGNNRIQVFDPDGKFLLQFPHVQPYEIQISRKTGEGYIMGTETEAGTAPASNNVPTVTKITKYSADWPPKRLYQSESLGKVFNYWRTMALDESGPPRLMLVPASHGVDFAHGTSGSANNKVAKMADLGGKFGNLEIILGQEAPRNYFPVVAGWDSDVICGGSTWFDGRTGACLGSRAAGDEVKAARDGTWVVRSGFFEESISVFPADWPANPKAKPIREWKVVPPSLNRNKKNGFGVAPNGDVYIARYYQWHGLASARAGSEGNDMFMAVDHYSPDGKMLRQPIYELSHAAQSPVVDIRGNIYVLDNNGRKLGQFYEDDIASNLPSWFPKYEVDWEKVRKGEAIAVGYEKFVWDPLIKPIGVVYKFSPKGGGLLWRAAMGPYNQLTPQVKTNDPMGGKYLDWGYPFKPKPDRPATHWSATQVTIDKVDGMYPQWQDGVEWEFLGVGPVWGRYNKCHSSCVCMTCRIAVDDFGRVFAPASHRSTVRMIDTAGNEVLRIGRYGNLDSAMPGNALGVEMPMRYPSSVSLSKRFLYVAEARDANILKIKLGYQQEKSGEVDVK